MFDIYAAVTERIITEIEKDGVLAWHKPWLAAGSAISYTTGKPYSLLNQLLLGRAGEWLTWNQVQQEGGFVRKGEKARFVVFWKWIEKEDEETGEVKQIPFLKHFNVFHISQCEGIAAKHMQASPNPASPNETAETIIADYVKRSGVTIEHREGDSAFYNPAQDRIVLPMMAQFTETAEYYGTCLHECIHSTGHMNRLARLDSTAHFGSEAYSKEELIAEIGSAALVHHCGMETASSFRNSAAYVANWLTALKNDKRLIVSAAGKAEKAVNFILGA
ncbi:MAG: DUF1738 domain-containing protein [Clostridia bacterium]|nr:DUF1738 domain-containing protein [Clostridia bacterium]